MSKWAQLSMSLPAPLSTMSQVVSQGLSALKGKPFVLRKLKIVQVLGVNRFVVYRPDSPGKSLGGSLEVIIGEQAHNPAAATEQWKSMLRHQINRRRVEIRELEAQLLNPQITIPPGWARDD